MPRYLQEPQPVYLRTAEVADLLHVSPKTVSRWAKEGKLPFLKTLGGHRRYPDIEIRALADGLQENPDALMDRFETRPPENARPSERV